MVYTFATSHSAPIIAAYLAMVFSCKPLMRIVPKLELRKPLVLHNLLCSMLSLYAVVVFIAGLVEVRNMSACWFWFEMWLS